MMFTAQLTIVVVSIFNTFASDSRPNILLFFPDQWRFDWADKYYQQNLSINTPTVSALISSGTRFINANVASPLCAPSRSCLAAGKEYDFTGVPGNDVDFPENETTIYQLLQQAGYWVMISGKDDLTKKSGPGLNGSYRAKQLGYSDSLRVPGKDIFDNYPQPSDPYSSYLYNLTFENMTRYDQLYQCQHNYCCYGAYSNDINNGHECPGYLIFEPEMYEDNWVNNNAIKLLERKPKGQQWFIQIDFPGPHPAFIITKPMNESVNDRHYSQPINSTLNHKDVEIMRRDYVAEIENMDSLFENILMWLKTNNEYNNTIICASSDHGDVLGDFNGFGKARPWVGSTNVPLICVGPNIKKNYIVDIPVSNMDLAGTFLDYGQVNIPPNCNITSMSLRPLMEEGIFNEYKYRDYVLSGIDNWRLSIQQINSSCILKYICCIGVCKDRPYFPMDKYNQTKLLFDIVQDPQELNNIGAQYPDIMKQMNKQLPLNFCK
eukprot:252397_1